MASLLFQVTGPAHIPWQDPRWQELLHGYNVWVHVEVAQQEYNNEGGGGSGSGSGGLLLHQACRSLTLHAPQSSNLAALAMHVTRMLKDLTVVPPVNATPTQQPSSSANPNTTSSSPSSSTTTPQNANAAHATSVAAFSTRIALVGKSRATAGALNLIRLLVHSVLVHASSSSLLAGENNNNGSSQHSAGSSYVRDCFVYRNRDTHREHETGSELLTALLGYLTSNPSLNATVPELYDATILSFELLLVLLSSQLYEPLISSFQRRDETEDGYHDDDENENGDAARSAFWVYLMRSPPHDNNASSTPPSSSSSWTARQLLRVLLEWTVHRPPAPPKSIAHHLSSLAHSVVQAKGELLGKDGMYESHLVVHAYSPESATHETTATSSHALTAGGPGSSAALTTRRNSSNLLLDATKGVLVLSSTIILLPFRLVSLALGLWGHAHSKEKGYDQAHKQRFKAANSLLLTKDVLWLSNSLVADLASCVLLLLLHNDRAGPNPFRDEVARLADNRWESSTTGVELGDNGGGGGVDLPDLPDLPAATNGGGSNSWPNDYDEAAPLVNVAPPPSPAPRRSSSLVARQPPDQLSFNFELLFEAFGRTAHNEVGAVLLYTLMQSSQAFADSIAVRSDLDTLVLPLLRTLYYSSALRHYAAQDYASKRNSQPSQPAPPQQPPPARRRPSNESFSSTSTLANTPISIRNCPFRSQSQLYVIIILLLLFSQDPSFGTDAFRRVHVSTVLWYKERYLKDINLGSILVLCLLRSLTFNLNRLRDSFLLSNCCAILMNLSPNITDLHEYAAMRLVSITLASMKRYTALRLRHPEHDDAHNDDFVSTPTALHGEVSRTLLRVVKSSLSVKNVDRNLNLVYALVYHQADWKKHTNAKGTFHWKSG